MNCSFLCRWSAIELLLLSIYKCLSTETCPQIKLWYEDANVPQWNYTMLTKILLKRLECFTVMLYNNHLEICMSNYSFNNKNLIILCWFSQCWNMFSNEVVDFTLIFAISERLYLCDLQSQTDGSFSKKNNEIRKYICKFVIGRSKIA